MSTSVLGSPTPVFYSSSPVPSAAQTYRVELVVPYAPSITYPPQASTMAQIGWSSRPVTIPAFINVSTS
ncbi:hypothetical protein BDM02DRAFT_3124704, partial [Thelephora ganbajun]